MGSDIIWGNLDQWIHPIEFHDYDIVTICKIGDASRLFLRGQFSLHKYIPCNTFLIL